MPSCVFCLLLYLSSISETEVPVAGRASGGIKTVAYSLMPFS